MPRHTHRRAVLFLLAVGVGMYLVYGLTVITIGDGAARYHVRLASAAPIRVAGVEAIGRPEHLEFPLEWATPDSLRYPVSAEGLRGEPFEVFVPLSIRTNGLGCETSYYQHRYLAVVAILADGRRVAKVVELPDARESREVTVRLD